MFTTLNSRVWAVDYITITRHLKVPRFGKQIDAIIFICKHSQELSPIQTLNAMEVEDQSVQMVE